jgi:DNA-directed RNA polymerase, mitochondrial
LASAAASPDLLRVESYLDYDPRRDLQSASSYRSQRHILSDIPPHEPDGFLMIDDTVSEAPERLSSNRFKEIQIRGNAQEVKTTMEACLQVHRFDRAMALLRQLQIVVNPRSAYLREAFNDCLHAMIMDMIVNKNKTNVDIINQWLEVEMHNAGVEPDATTYALKVKVALATMTGSKRDRTVRRYWELARQDQSQNEVASLRDILSEQDLGKLSEIVPQTRIDYGLEDNFEEYDVSSDHLQIVAEPALAQRPVDEIRETNQKGLGLTSLRKSLSLFSENSHFERQGQESEKSYAHARQSRLEKDAVKAAIERWRVEHEKMVKMGINGRLQGGKLGAMLWQWHQKVSKKLLEELKLVEAAEAKVRKSEREKLRCEYGPFLRLLEPDHLAALVTITAISTVDKNGMQAPMKLARMVSDVGRMVEAEARAEQLRVSGLEKRGPWKPSAADSVSEETRAKSAGRPTRASRTPSKQSRASARSLRSHYQWSAAIHARVGAILCEMLFDAAKMVISKEDPASKKMLYVSQPVFSRNVLFEHGRKVGVVVMHAGLVEKLMQEPPGDLIAKHLPMVCEPKPWTGFLSGGFLETQTTFLRVKLNEITQRDYAEAAAARGDLDQVFAGVDVLGKTGWKINQDVFSVMLKAWNSGEGVANLPPINKVFELPEKPADTNDVVARAKWYNAMRKIENEKSGIHSHRCFQNFQMEIAKAYSKETFYLPHNIDFRGRAYPIPPYLNQMGADNCRGLLLFANGRELGEQGLKWIKIHLSNVFGYDKASLTDRENFPMEHLSDVIDSVNHPLDGRRWWLSAEDPWQCLASCFELKQALDLPDPTKFVSHLPVHQDGSCNGLQHYAALGGDIAGAKQVNLEPGDKPSDVYTGVAELVKAEVKEDAAQGDEMAKLLDGRITRKIVKQTVMTNVYGVTFLGAIRQVRRQLDGLMPELREGTVHRSPQAATYVARKIFKALGAMFTGAHDIQYWLGDCATKIATSLSPAQLQKVIEAEDNGNSDHSGAGLRSGNHKKAKQSETMAEVASFRSSVIWTTPLRLPVVQPYRVSNGRRVQTNLQEITLTEPTVADAVNKRKQLQAFPPNFIHSLDATHMLLSALKCHEVGLTFSAVHDSFWTHAADVNTLNRLLRDAFIRMHSEDIIGRLSAEFKTRYRGHLYLASICSSSILGKEIKAFRTQFHASKGNSHNMRQRQYAELVLEARRQSLLKHHDPAERAKGEAMVTPCSMFEKCDGHQYLKTRESLGETAIGAIPDKIDPKLLEKALQSDDDVAVDVDMEHALEPLLAGVDVEKEVEGQSYIAADEGEVLADKEEEKKTEKKKKKGKKSNRKPEPVSWLWMPLTFKAIPQKVCLLSLLSLSSFFPFFSSNPIVLTTCNRANSTSPVFVTASTSSPEPPSLSHPHTHTPTHFKAFVASLTVFVVVHNLVSPPHLFLPLFQDYYRYLLYH